MRIPALQGIRVLDFTTLLPGPLATLLLAEAGATVLKIEPPGGDTMRTLGDLDDEGVSIPFRLLNRGKRLQTLDLKSGSGRTEALALARDADILVEQFRPGVMDRLGLGFAALQDINPRLIYASISGYARTSPEARRAGHDLNYMADAGLLHNVAGTDGAAVLPHSLVADIGAGAWPAVMNILLALLRRQADGSGCHIELAMADGVWPFQLMALSNYWATGRPAVAGSGELCGGRPRYQVYRTRDDRWLALGALEDRFFARFLELAGLRGDDGTGPLDAVPREAIAARICEETSQYWLDRCAGEDVCVSLVRNIDEAIRSSAVADVRAFLRAGPDAHLPPLPLPVDPQLRRTAEHFDAATSFDAASGWPR